jgi:flagellar hook assembly protein FlgD
MRNTIKTIAALLIVLSAVKTSAKGDSTSVGTYCKIVAQEKEDNFKLIYKGEEEDKVTIQWIDENNETVYKEDIKSTDAFVKQYNLSTLPDGKYTIQLTTDNYKYAEEVILGDMSDLRFTLRGSDEKNVIMTGYNPESKDVHMYVLDDKNERIYYEAYDSDVIQKKYNFKDIKSREVTVVLMHRGKIFQEKTITF